MTVRTKNGASAAVREYMSENPNRDINLSELERKLHPLTAQAIRNAMNHRIASGDPISRVVIGHTWKWVPGATVVGNGAVKQAQDMLLVKLIGTTTDQELILQDTESGTLYRAREL